MKKHSKRKPSAVPRHRLMLVQAPLLSLLFASGTCLAANGDNAQAAPDQGTANPGTAAPAATAPATATVMPGPIAQNPVPPGTAVNPNPGTAAQGMSDQGMAVEESAETSNAGVLHSNDPKAIRNEVFGLAANGGAVKAIEEAKSRPDIFTAVDLAQLEELSIRQEARGGRDKARSMTSPDRFDGIHSALRSADEFDARLPKTPEYKSVRAALAGDRTFAYANLGEMQKAVDTFETIPAGEEVSIDALAAAGDAYMYLGEPSKATDVYLLALKQAKLPPDPSARGFQYGPRTRVIDIQADLFWAYSDQGRMQEAGQVVDDMGRALPPSKQVYPGSPAAEDYMRYYRLRAQYLINTGRQAEGVAALKELETQVPFNAEVRVALADSVSNQGHPRESITMYNSALTDHPDNVEIISGLGRASIASDDYDTATKVDQTLGNAFPDNVAVRQFKRDYNAYRSPEMTTDLSFEHGNGALADNAFTSDTYVYSQPMQDNWRVFSHNFWGFGQTELGRVTRFRTGVGGDYRHEGLDLQAEATQSIGPDHRTGGRGSISYNLNDYWTVSGDLDSNSNSLPWKAYTSHILGKSADIGVTWRQDERRQVSMSYGVTRYTDGNTNQSISATATQRLFTFANQFVNASLNFGTDSNTLRNTAYYAPHRDYAVDATLMHQWTVWQKGDQSLKQNLYLTGGMYNEQGFGTSALWDARLEHAWSFRHDITLSYGIDVSNHAYDGKRELSETGYLSLRVPF